MSRLAANLTLLAAAAFWGMGFVAQSTAMADLGPFLFTGLRFACAALLVLPLALHEARKPAADPVSLPAMALIGVFLFLAIIVQQVGLITTTVTNSGFLTALYVVLVPMVAFIVFRERPLAVIVPGAAMALAGLYLLTGADLAGMRRGDLLMVASAAFWAVQVVLIGRMMAGTNRPFALAATQFAVTALLGLVIGLAIEPAGTDAVLRALPEILYAGLVSGGVAFTLQIIGQRHTSSAQAALILSTESVFAAAFGALFLGERLTSVAALGAALILGAILLVELVAIRAAKSPET